MSASTATPAARPTQSELRRCRDELELHYQPPDLDDGHRWPEALVRWRHGERGLLPSDRRWPNRVA